MPSEVDSTRPEQRILEQSVRLPPGGAVTGWAAIRLLGAGFFDGLATDGQTLLPVPLAIGSLGNIRPAEGSVLMRDRLDPHEVVLRYGIPCACAERATFDAARTASGLTEAAVRLDMAFAGEITSTSRMGRYVDARPGWGGVPLVRGALGLVSEHSWSPNETRYRLIWTLEAGLPPPLVNQPLFDLRGRLLGFPDLLDVESGLVGEFDGAEHRGAVRHSRDVDREALLRQHWLEVTRATGPDLSDPARLARRIVSARQRARLLPRGRRTWTVTPPDGWDQGPDLDQRLDHRDFMDEARAAWDR